MPVFHALKNLIFKKKKTINFIVKEIMEVYIYDYGFRISFGHADEDAFVCIALKYIRIQKLPPCPD